MANPFIKTPSPGGPIPMPYPLTAIDKAHIRNQVPWFVRRARGLWANPSALSSAAADALAGLHLPANKLEDAVKYLLLIVIHAAVATGGAVRPESLDHMDPTTLVDKLRSVDDLSEEDMLKIQQLTHQRAEAFATVSSILKSLNDSRKNIISNIR